MAQDLRQEVPDATTLALAIAKSGAAGVSVDRLRRVVGLPPHTLEDLLWALAVTGQVVMLKVGRADGLQGGGVRRKAQTSAPGRQGTVGRGVADVIRHRKRSTIDCRGHHPRSSPGIADTTPPVFDRLARNW